MILFGEFTKIKIADFALNWRWTDPHYCMMPLNDIGQIYPVDEESSKYIWDESLLLIDDHDELAVPNDKFLKCELADIDQIVDVIDWLKQRLPKCDVVINWQPDCSVITNTALFIRYWDDFCYLSSDDVSIWPEDQSWVLHYHHSNVFVYGSSKRV